MAPDDRYSRSGWEKPLIAIFGRYVTQSILLAKKPGRVLWSDDFVQSSIAVKEYRARVAWTELVVAHLESRGLFARKEAVATVTALLGYRYEVVSITPAIFVEAARRAIWDKNAPPFSLALAPFANLRITENIFAIIGGIASEAVREIEDVKKRQRGNGTTLPTAHVKHSQERYSPYRAQSHRSRQQLALIKLSTGARCPGDSLRVDSYRLKTSTIRTRTPIGAEYCLDVDLHRCGIRPPLRARRTCAG